MNVGFNVYASLLSATPDDASNVASWLADREAAKEAEKMVVDETVQDSVCMSSESVWYDKTIGISQIRILSKRYTTDPDVIPYVAVIDKWDDDMWLIVPFSPYKTPATPGEMATGLDVHGLHVLQPWNGRTVQESILKRSYLFGTLPDEVRTNTLLLFQNQLLGNPLPAGFTARRGTPIVEAADPRREYLEECMARFQPLSQAVMELAEGTIDTRTDVINQIFDKYPSLERNDYALAAATDDGSKKHIPVLMHKDAWDAMGDCRVASDFCGYSAHGGGEQVLSAYLCGNLPQELDGKRELPVLVCKRETRAVVGKGKLRRQDDGRIKIVVRLGDECDSVDIQDASELVFVVA